MRTRLALAATAVSVTAVAIAASVVLAPASAGAAPASVEAALTAAESDAGPAAERDGKRRHRMLSKDQRQQLRSTGHITLTKKTREHGTVSLALQRGEVTAVSPTSITLVSRDDYTHTYAITDKTKLRLRHQPAAITDVTVGARAMVVALVGADGAADNARRILLRPSRGDHAGISRNQGENG